MINTFHTSLPPPVPPRQGLHPPPRGRMTPLLWFLSVIMVLQMVVTFGGFVYLFRKSSMLQTELQGRQYDDLIVLKRLQECDVSSDYNTLLDCGKLLSKYRSIISKVSQAEGKAGFLSAGMPFYGSGAVAHMTVERRSGPSTYLPPAAQTLKWNRDHSLLMKVEYLSSPGALKIVVPGDYYVYSQVTFTKVHPKIPLVQTIMRKSADKEDLLLKAFCSMRDEEAHTSFQGGVFRLEKEEQLSLNVTDMNLINFDVTTTAFGLFRL
ncbi:CD40 ligand [Megalops cyprinoides]|uniref:CD40 ligand n=1 Tax=Megalops cyprinoides TaxID=118141 RepID=UPI0018654749|nr:CD40 ligand [Megalops cyprinoides]